MTGTVLRTPSDPILAGRVALVTGAARGLGLAIAETLAQAGAIVLVNDVVAETAEGAASALRARGATAEALPFDAHSDAAHAQIDAAVAKQGRLDILVNNTGIGDFVGLPLVGLTEAERALEVVEAGYRSAEQGGGSVAVSA